MVWTFPASNSRALVLTLPGYPSPRILQVDACFIQAQTRQSTALLLLGSLRIESVEPAYVASAQQNSRSKPLRIPKSGRIATLRR
jgi:hypothetical protein